MPTSAKPGRRALRSTRLEPRSAPTLAASAPRRRPGRPRVTPEQLRERIATYCRRYDAHVVDDALPPFPAGKRESLQHREWMALYKARRRIQDRPEADDEQRLRELLAAQHARCPICGKKLHDAEARLERIRPAALHPDCLRLLTLSRLLGPDAVERTKRLL